MRLAFGDNEYEISFGRAKKSQRRETIVIYESRGFYVSKIRKVISKPVSKEALRNFAKIPVVRRAIELKKNGLLNLPWQIEKCDINDEYDYADEIKCLTKCFTQPNNGESFRELIGAAIEDIETGDCGAIEIVKTNDFMRPFQLFTVDGFTIEVNSTWDNNPKTVRYLQRNPETNKYVELLNSDLMYLKRNNYTYTPLGSSPVEAAFKIIHYLLNSQEYAGTVTSNAIPKFILNLGKQTDENKIASFRKYFDEDIYGTGTIPIVGGSEGIQTHQLTAINDDGLYLQWQHFLITIIAYTFGIDPKRFNEGSQTDRSTVDEQKENINDEAIRPLAILFEENFNNKVLARLGFGGKLRFKFEFEDTESRKTAKSKRFIGEHDDDILTLNEVRQMLGYQKLDNEYGDMLKSEFKAVINQKYNIQGGYNGVGKNRHENNNNTGGENKE